MKSFKFPAGEISVRINSEDISADGTFYHCCKWNCHADLFEMALAVDAARRLGAKKVKLFIPYLPYSRQDRVCNEGEAFSLEVICNFINSMKADSVLVYDLHSDVVRDKLDNLIVREQHEIFDYNYNPVMAPLKNHILVCPDQGAHSKIKAFCRPYIRYEKVRDPLTGDIKKIELVDHNIELHKDYLIVDDICDGGSTFIMIAKDLRRRGVIGRLALVTTHGIYSKGTEKLREYFDDVICAVGI